MDHPWTGEDTGTASVLRHETVLAPHDGVPTLQASVVWRRTGGEWRLLDAACSDAADADGRVVDVEEWQALYREHLRRRAQFLVCQVIDGERVVVAGATTLTAATRLAKTLADEAGQWEVVDRTTGRTRASSYQRSSQPQLGQ